MNSNVANAFETIESASHFMSLLAETIIETKRDVEGDVLRESSVKKSERLDVLRMALYSLSKLEGHMMKSCHILSDLRQQRDLLSRP